MSQKAKNNITFENIGFNKTSLAGKSLADLTKEVGHHFPAGSPKIQELYNLINGDNKKPAGQVEGAQTTAANPK